MIQVSLLNKYYNKGKKNEIHVINNTTLTLEDTGLVCILGESGSGKTTLMNTISGLDDFHDGTIRIGEEEIKKYGSKKQETVRNESFGYIFQNYYLLMDRTVEYNISLALSLYHLSEKEEQERIDYVLKAVDMERYKKRRISQLSGGQQQRVAIARAIAKTPKVIFADEPTGNLDEANTLKIMGILKKMSETCLVVLVTHERSIAEYFADRIIWIADGKIEKDELSDGKGSYKAVQDQNIYLKEYEKSSSRNGNVTVEQYRQADEEKEAEKPLTLQLVYENGTWYVHAPEGSPVEFLSENKEKRVIDDYRPHLEKGEAERLGDGYALASLTVKGTPRLNGREIFRIARQNLAALGKKQAFLAVSLLVMSVLVVLTLQDILTMYLIDEQSIVTADSHFVQVSITKNDMILDSDYENGIRDLLSDFRESQGDALIYPISKAAASYHYEGFWQLENVSASLKGFSVLPLEYISEDDLIYGEMPDEAGEIAVDKWVLENFMKSDNIMSNITTSLETFMEGYVVINKSNYKIVGITDMGEPDIFVNGVEGLGWISSLQNCAMVSLEQLKRQYPEEYGDVSLESGQVLVNQSMAETLQKSRYRMQFEFWQGVDMQYDIIENRRAEIEDIRTNGVNAECIDAEYYQDLSEEEREEGLQEVIQWKETLIEDELAYLEIKMQNVEEDGTYEGVSHEDYEKAQENLVYLPLTVGINNATYDVAGVIPDVSQSSVAAVRSEDMELFADSLIISQHAFYIYSEDKETTIQAVKNLLTDEVKEKLNVKAVDAKQEQLKEAVAARDLRVNARMILTITIFVVSLVILYFMMKASAVNRIGDLAVYRLLGITKGSIYLMFALETAMFSCCTTLVGVAAATLATKFLASIPSLQITINFPWYMAVLTFSVLFVIHIITGVLPIVRLLRLPPARLAAKYDI